ncbi:MAG: radical SAM protein [Clostridia bacterium]|nr:radical SAM protein [Clostridia bacterium]
MRLALNKQFTIRNESGCSYLIKVNGVDGEAPKDYPSVTILPPVIGFIISSAINTSLENAQQNISSELGVSESIIGKFLHNCMTPNNWIMSWNGIKLHFPSKLLWIENDKEIGYIHKIEENPITADKRFIEKRPFAPININLMVTTRCYTDCIYCYANRHLDKELTFEELQSIIYQCKEIGVVNLNLTGGDFFVRKDWKEILHIVSECEYKPFLSTKKPLNIEEITYILSKNISEIQFSLDSIDDNILSTLVKSPVNYSKKVEQMFEICDSLGLNLCVRTVLCNQNAELFKIRELYDFLSRHTCVKDWVITPAFFSENKKENYHSYEVDNSCLIKIKNFVTSKHSIFPIYLSKITDCGYKLQYYKDVEQYVTMNQKCFANSFSMSILASGECTICEMLYNNPEYLLGNIRSESIVQIWNSKKAWSLYSPNQHMIYKESPCSMCTVFDKCRGSIAKKVCYVDMAKAYNNHSFSEPDPRCPTANPINIIL